MHTKKLIFLFYSLFIFYTAYEQPKKDNNKKIQAKTINSHAAQVNTLLWEISGNGLSKPSYLFGTMHILCASDARLSESLKKVIQSADKIYFEIDMDDIEQLMGGLKYMRMNDGTKISDLLSAEEYARLDAWFKKNKTMLPLAMMNRFKPLLVSGLVGETLMNCETKDGMEAVIMKEAKLQEKQIFGLETVSYQSGLLDSIPYSEQARDLMNYIDSIDQYKNLMKEMVDVYKSQDLARMDVLTQKSDPGMSDYLDLLLYNRNRRWAQDIAFKMNEGCILFAVGAGHLPGEQGVITLLRKRGYTLKPIPNNWK